MLSAKQGNYWYHFYNDFGTSAVLDWGLNPRPPALEASTLPLGYREDGGILSEYVQLSHMCFIVIDSTHAAAEMNPVRTTKIHCNSC